MESVKTVSKSIRINAPASRVWAILTDPDRIKVWMSEAEINIITDWVVGSPIIFQSNVNGKHEYKGVILQLEPEKVFRYSSWSKISRLPDQPENYSLIEFRLTPMENQTTLTVTHSNLIAKAAIEHSNFYWNGTLEIIRQLTEG
ncbi:SRPBCC family protein [Runella sp.]|uniref:SRPBCC family protein n=1 Tax=Runella sp. TaxID=1960881 RepID=UPI003D148B8A